MRVAFLSSSFATNAVGRVYCLWLLTEHLGWESTTFGPVTSEFWSVLQGSSFQQSCVQASPSEIEKRVANFDLIIACKPLPESFGVGLAAGRAGNVPLIVDIDDPDIETALSGGGKFRSMLRMFAHPITTRRLLSLRGPARRTPAIVSNPWLQSRYGGIVVPHARLDIGDGAEHTTDRPTVAFIGTARVHKGIRELRAAVETVQAQGYELLITDDPPADARPWEQWVGNVPMAEGLSLVRNADIVVLPSRLHSNATGQLPAKLVDAMLLGRAVAVSAVDPLPWAVGDAGVVFPPQDVPALVESLLKLQYPQVRAALGTRARELALSRFSVPAVAQEFERACLDAINGRS